MQEALREKITSEIASVAWHDLRSHAERGVVFLVSGELTLLEAAMAVAQDATDRVQQWLDSGELAHPTEDELRSWGQDPERPFDHVIVRPFILARPAAH